jgi:hypothetical protein
MTIEELLTKAKSEWLTPEEQQALLTGTEQELVTLKASDPAKYLALLEELNAVVKDLNTDLKQATVSE